ncbi:MAG: polysaccharide deacetylase family protein [Ferruginibacter sp.]
MFYFIKTPRWLRKLYKSCVWELPGNEKIIYLTFDDGPIPEITDFVLDQLKIYKAEATFFCIGKNVMEFPEIYKRIISDGHAVGNHTFNHLNGWKTKDNVYLANIEAAKKLIDSRLFRPPYGKITKFQIRALANKKYQLTPIMWTVLSGDFDKKFTPEKCLENVLKNVGSGSIIVFHDSEKAAPNMKYALPEVLRIFSEKGYSFEKIRL